jgi:hypothetical protein
MNKYEEEFKSKILNKFNGSICLDDVYINAKTNVFIKGSCNHRWIINPSNLLSRGTGQFCTTCFGKSCGKNKIWTADEINFLKLNYTTLTNPEIFNKLNRTAPAIFAKAKELGLSKPDRFLHHSLDKVNIRIKDKFPDLEILYYNNNADKTSMIKNSRCGHTWEVSINSIFNSGSGSICRICYPAKNSKRSLDSINIQLEKKTKLVKCIEYGGIHNNSLFKCLFCGDTWISIANNIFVHDYGYICRKCNPNQGISFPEKELLEFIKNNYDGWIIENDRKTLSGQELDIVLPDLGLAFEYNGLYWHSDKFKNKTYHLDKSNLLKENIDYQLIHINEDEWDNKQDIVKSRILSLLGKTTKIYARKCILKEISFPRTFLDENHIQGHGSPSAINLGLYYNKELVAVMTFSKPRFSSNYDYELVRYCSKLNTTVVGGASKLFSYFNNNYLGSVVSYSDKRWSSGNLYKKLGFEYSHTSEPNYRYYKGNISLSRYQCQKHKLADLLKEEFDPELSEYENMTNAGYIRVYDCGNDVWVFI